MFFMIANKGTSSVVCITYYYYTTRTFINTLVVPLFVNVDYVCVQVFYCK